MLITRRYVHTYHTLPTDAYKTDLKERERRKEKEKEEEKKEKKKKKKKTQESLYHSVLYFLKSIPP